MFIFEMSHRWKGQLLWLPALVILLKPSLLLLTRNSRLSGLKKIQFNPLFWVTAGWEFLNHEDFLVVYKKIPSGEQKCTLISITLQFSNRFFLCQGVFCSARYCTWHFQVISRHCSTAQRCSVSYDVMAPDLFFLRGPISVTDKQAWQSQSVMLSLPWSAWHWHNLKELNFKLPTNRR